MVSVCLPSDALLQHLPSYLGFSYLRWGNSGNSVRLYFWGSKITADGDCSREIKRCLLLRRKVMTNLDSIFKSRDIICNKGPSSQGFGFSSGHVWMWELDCEESWALKNWCFWNIVLEKTLENPLNCREIHPVHSKGDQSWVFIGRTNTEAEAPILWQPHAKSWLIGKDPDAGRDWGQEEKGTTEDEMAVWHHWLNGHEFELVIDREAWRAVIHGIAKSWHDWATELNWTYFQSSLISKVIEVYKQS